MSNVLEVRDLTIGTTAGQLTIVDRVGFSVSAGECLGLVGESGSGKSLTGLAIANLLPDSLRITDGQVHVAGELESSATYATRSRRVGMIFQNPMSSLNPSMRIGRQIQEAMDHNADSAHRRFDSVVELLQTVGIPEPKRRARQWPHELSGGQRQRVMIALALACGRQVLVADEPTTALDVTTQASVVGLLDELRADLGIAVVLISHDLALVSNVCSELLVMYAGQIVEAGSTADLLRSPTHPYLRGLMNCIPGEPGTAIAPLRGRVPRPDEYAEGCRFANRCDFHEQACDQPQELVLRTDRKVRCRRADELEAALCSVN